VQSFVAICKRRLAPYVWVVPWTTEKGMARDKELETGLRRMSEDFYLPGGGRMKLSRLVAEHLGWFDVAELRGMGWRDMIRALTAAGVVGRTGKHLSVGTLSSTIWRERDKTKQEDLGACADYHGSWLSRRRDRV
jgi:hypothetical protein